MENFIGLDKVRYLLVDAGVRYYEDATVDGNKDISVYDMYESGKKTLFQICLV